MRNNRWLVAVAAIATAGTACIAGAAEPARRNVAVQPVQSAAVPARPAVAATGGVRRGSNSRLQMGLEAVAAAARAPSADAVGLAAAFPDLPISAQGGKAMISVDLVARRGGAEALAAELRNLGATHVAVYRRMVGALVPVSALDKLERSGNLLQARPVLAVANRGTFLTQNDFAMNGPFVRPPTVPGGPTGAGITVGVLSDSFGCLGTGNTAAIDLANNEFDPVTVLQEATSCSGRIDEGRAMIQLVADIAPGSTQLFHSAFISQADFALGIGELATAGADVIVDDIIYFAEPMFQDGIVAQAADAVHAQGIPYFSSAGNQARRSYEATWTSAATPIRAFYTGQGYAGPQMDFDPGPGEDIAQSVTIPTGATIRIALQWDEPFASIDDDSPGSASDIDVYLFNNLGTAVAIGGGFNTGADPAEVMAFTNGTANTAFTIEVVVYEGPAPTYLKYVNFGSSTVAVNEFATNSGASYGHAPAAGAFSTGAARWYQTPACGQTPPLLESFSSAGGTPILMQTDGTRLEVPLVRDKPDATGPQGGNTSFFGQEFDFASATPECVDDDNLVNNFFGTSASAPMLAGLAALMLEVDPTAEPQEIYDAMRDTAIDMGAAGFDYDSGHGYVTADAAIGGLCLGGRLEFNNLTAQVPENQAWRLVAVNRVGGSCGAVGVDFAASTGTAGHLDFTPVNGTLAWADGETESKKFKVLLLNDALDENPETINLALSNATGGATAGGAATITIADEDPPPTVTLSGDVTVPENSEAHLTFTLSALSGKDVVVRVAHSGTAVRAVDYVFQDQYTTIPAGQLSVTRDLRSDRTDIHPDNLVEGDETIIFTINGATNAVIGGANSHTITIDDEDD